LRTLWTVLRLGRQADVLFVNGLALEASCANFFLRKPVVLKVVGDWAWERTSNEEGMRAGFEEFQSQPSTLKVRVRKALRSWWTRQADRVIVPSRYLAQWVRKWGIPEEKITVVYNAVESSNGIQPASLPLSSSLVLRGVTVSRLIPCKRVDGLVRAVAQLDNVGLVIVGDGPERERLEAAIHAAGVADRVYCAGQRSKAETLALMAACDLFMLNSTHEGLPHVVLEAMDMGLPVIATAVGGTPEVVEDGENGRLIAPTDANLLCAVLSPLVSSPSERQRLALGAKRTAARFRFSIMVQETEALLLQSAGPTVGGHAGH
jgi:glycosyltransferase involved in cell wall biosynthesis